MGRKAVTALGAATAVAACLMLSVTVLQGQTGPVRVTLPAAESMKPFSVEKILSSSDGQDVFLICRWELPLSTDPAYRRFMTSMKITVQMPANARITQMTVMPTPEGAAAQLAGDLILVGVDGAVLSKIPYASTVLGTGHALGTFFANLAGRLPEDPNRPNGFTVEGITGLALNGQAIHVLLHFAPDEKDRTVCVQGSLTSRLLRDDSYQGTAPDNWSDKPQKTEVINYKVNLTTGKVTETAQSDVEDDGKHDTYQLLAALRGHTAGVRSVAFSRDSRRIVSCGKIGDATVKIWDVAAQNAVKTMKGHARDVNAAVFSPDGRQIVSGGDDTTVRLWDATSGQLEQTLKGHTSYVMDVALSPNGRTIASCSDDTTVRLWDASSGKTTSTINAHSSRPENRVSSVAFSADGKRIVSTSNDRTARIWDAATAQLLQTLSGHQAPVMSAAFSPDGRLVATGSRDGTIRIWDAASGKTIHILGGHSSGVEAVAFSPDGRLVASGGGDRVLRIWDVGSGQQTQALQGHSGGIESVAFSPDGRYVASGSLDRTIRLWTSKIPE